MGAFIALILILYVGGQLLEPVIEALLNVLGRLMYGSKFKSKSK
jgi:hypothetical protein